MSVKRALRITLPFQPDSFFPRPGNTPAPFRFASTTLTSAPACAAAVLIDDAFKIVIFPFLFFATLALATRTPEGQLQDPEALISSTNIVVKRTLLPLSYLTSVNATEDKIRLVINDVVEIVDGLTGGLRESSLSSCANGCTALDIVELIAITLKIICEPLGIAYGIYPSIVTLLGPTRLVGVMVELLDAVLVLVGGIFGQLVVLLIRNGCAGIMADLQLVGLLTALGLDGFGRLCGFIGKWGKWGMDTA